MSKSMRLWPVAVAVCAAALSSPASALAVCGADEIPGGPGSTGINLVITGTPAKQTLIVNVSAASTTVYLDCNGNNQFTDAGDLNGSVFANDHRVFDIQLGGYDVITFNVAGDLNNSGKNAQIVLGPGINTVNVTSTATLIDANSRVLVDVIGNAGPDTITGSIGSTIDASTFQIRADLGLGNDSVNVAFPGAFVNGAVISVDGQLGAGVNAFAVSKTGTFTTSTMNVDVEGGPWTDSVQVFLGSPLAANSRYFASAELGAGNDTFKGSVDFTQLQLGAGSEAHFRARGGLGNDTLSVTRNGTTGNVIQSGGMLDVDLNAGAGYDSITVDLGGSSYNPGSNSLLRLRADGGVGNDIMSFVVDAVAASTPNIDASITGGSGNDAVSIALNDNGGNAAANYGPAGVVLIDGGGGVDSCPTTGNGLFHRRGCES
jgi:hypothetical protein